MDGPYYIILCMPKHPHLVARSCHSNDGVSATVLQGWLCYDPATCNPHRIKGWTEFEDVPVAFLNLSPELQDLLGVEISLHGWLDLA